MKNLINYLSKKSLSLGNGSGMTRKRLVNDSGMTRFSLASLICLCMLTIGSGNVWGATDTEAVLNSSLPVWSKVVIIIIVAIVGGVSIHFSVRSVHKRNKSVIKINTREQSPVEVATTQGDNSPVNIVRQKKENIKQTNIYADKVIVNDEGSVTHYEDNNDTPSDYTKAKLKTHILFVDDKDDFNTIQIVKDAGWKNVMYIKDISNLDCEELKIADIIFIDINGVASKLYKKEGLGLAADIKRRYKDKKKVILYSANPDGDRFDPDLKLVDYSLIKEAEPNQYINLIENFCHE